MSKIKVGVSSCVMGLPVRYDGSHKQFPLVTGTLSRYFDYVAICPEVGIGMSVPRDPIHLVGDAKAPRVVAMHDKSRDHTDKLRSYGQQKALEHDDLSGYIFMENSPSCGLFRVNVHQSKGGLAAFHGRGVYARAFTQMHPLLPVEESGRLCEPLLRESFVLRVFAYADWQQLKRDGLTYKTLLDFHVRYKYCLMAHSPVKYAELGRMLADAGKHDANQLADHYIHELMAALARPASRKTHTNVLLHIQGYLKLYLSASEKAELVDSIERYRTALVSRTVPVSLLQHHFLNHPVPYIAQQAYMQAYYDDLSLQNNNQEPTFLAGNRNSQSQTNGL